MRVSRAPEGRNTKKRLAFLGLGLGAIVAAVVVVFFLFGSESLSAKDEPAVGTQDTVLPAPSAGSQTVSLAPTPTPKPTATQVPVPTPAATPDPTPAPAPTAEPAPMPTPEPTAEPEAATVPQVYPDAQFGEVLEEGLVNLKLPRGELVKTWYSFQVDTETRDITLLFAQYDDALKTILTTVKIDNYTRGVDLNKAEVVLNYPDGSTRTLVFDGAEGSISLNQQYILPVGPSMFSSGLRRALVYYGMQLRDDAGVIEVELHLDLSGLSQSEGLEFKRLVPGTVDDVLMELQGLVEQIEDKRVQS